LAPAGVKRNNWWIVALVTGVLALVFIGFYFSSKGFNSSSAANQQKLVPQKQDTTPKTAP
jgi:hypothetical protein